MEDIVRVVRIIEYVGPRSKIDAQIERSLHGTHDHGNGVKITAVTLGTIPEIISRGELTPARVAEIIGKHFNPDAKLGEMYHDFVAIAKELGTWPS